MEEKGEKGERRVFDNEEMLDKHWQMVQEIKKETLDSLRLHFIFNTLNAIRFLIKKEPETAYDMVYDLAQYIRGCSDAIMCQDAVSLKEELACATAYAALEMTQRNHLKLCWQVEATEGYVPRGSIYRELERLFKQEVYGKREERPFVVSRMGSEASLCICIKETNQNSLIPIYKQEEEVGLTTESNVR